MNIEEFVNDYLKEHRHDVLLNPYNGLVDFANAFKEQMEETYCPRSEKWKEVEETARHEYENGWKDSREQMINGSVEGVIDDCGTPARLRLQMPDCSFRIGDKVRVIVCKNEE